MDFRGFYMKNWWNSLGIQLKLQIIIQLVLIAVLIPSQMWIEQHFKEQILAAAESRARVSADGVINGMNMLMIKGFIKDPESRELYIRKMAASEGVKELRIIRAKQVQDQFGPGLPQEQPVDDMDRSVIANAREEVRRVDDKSAPELRVVVPFIVSTDFRGTNCLECHHVQAGTANGAASITIDLKSDYASLSKISELLWSGQAALQLVLFFLIGRFTHTITRPLENLQTTMSALQKEEDLARYVGTMPPLQITGGDEIGKLSATFNRMVKTLQQQMISLRISEDMQQQYLSLEREEQARLMTLLAVMNVGVLFVSRDNKILYANPTFFNIWLIPPETKLVGKDVAEIPGYLSHLLANRKESEQHLLDVPEKTDLYLEDKRVVIQTCYAVRDVEAQVVGHLWLYEDVTHTRRTPEQLLRLAECDALTGLYNRHRFAGELERSLMEGKRNETRVALLSFSLDDMNSINDTYGYAAGDKILADVTEAIGKRLRRNELFFRLRGDEFAVLIPGTSEQGTQVLANRIEQTIAELRFDLSGQKFVITASFGIALYPDHGENGKELISHAEAAISLARKGSNKSLPD
jgi:diguanylate cyclase (GGDEF)-like protein